MPNRRKTKIVVTLGPSTLNKEKVEQLIYHGMNVLRINMNHGDYEEHMKKIQLVKSIDPRIPTIIDLAGLSIRTVVNENLNVKPGDKIVLGKDLNFNFPILENIQESQEILIEDGNVKLKVIEVGKEIIAEVIYGKEIKNKKNVNLPGFDFEEAIPTKKDIEDLNFGMKIGAEIFAISFVNSAEDVKRIRDYLEDNDYDAWLISKIETKNAVDRISSILKVSDGIMVARGDLALEIPMEKLPRTQKELINYANRKGKPVIVATQFLSSMVNNPLPTRAEISDIANAVFDGASALMLSNETSIGKYPIEAVKIMHKIIYEAEKYSNLIEDIDYTEDLDSIALAAYKLAKDLNAKYIFTPTHRGNTARAIARFKLKSRIIAISSSISTANRCNLLYGVDGIYREDAYSLEGIKRLIKEYKEAKKLKKNDYVVVVHINGETNTHLIRVIKVD